MVCRHCGKDAPDGMKFCIYCGGLLEDPEKEFMGRKFDTVEECVKVKQDYAALTTPFTPEDGNYLLSDLLKMIEDCKKGIYHPVASQLALEYLNPIAEKLQFIAKRDSKRGLVRILSSLYTAFSLVVLFSQSITEIGSRQSTYWDMIKLVIPGQIGLFTWIWNIIIVLSILFSIICLIAFIKDSDMELNVIAPFSLPFFSVLAWIAIVILCIFGLQYLFLSAFWWVVIGGILVGAINLIILPKKKQK